VSDTTQDIKDITIIGGGPTGLFAAFYAGLRGISCRVIDALPQLGGQLMALYPEKYIFDVGGLPRILAKDLAKNMIEQGTQFGPEVVLEAEVEELIREDGHIRLVTRRGDYLTKTVCITAGKGALNPRVLECPGWDDHYTDDGGVHTHVRQPEDFRGKRVLIVGGGDSAVDWVLGLRGIAREITLIHRRPVPRAQGEREEMRARWSAATSRSARRTRCAGSRGGRVRRTRHHLQQRHRRRRDAGGGSGDRAPGLQAGPGAPSRGGAWSWSATPSRSRS
jgi:ferredoxin/flavodoxin---NADP+ reductase